MTAHGQQEDRFLALVLYEPENDSHVESDARCPPARERPLELVASEKRLKDIVGETVQSEGKLPSELGILLHGPPGGTDESR